MPDPREGSTDMAYVKFNINRELRKFLKGGKTKVDPASLLFAIGDRHLDMLQDRADADWLEQLYRLEDPRGRA